MSGTYYSENAVLDSFFGRTLGRGTSASAIPAYWYIGLGNAEPSEDGTYSELDFVGDYTRIQVPNSSPYFGVSESQGATNGITYNLTSIQFSQCSSNWGTITHVLFFDEATGGNLWFWQALQSSVSGNIGKRIEFPSGSIQITNRNV